MNFRCLISDRYGEECGAAGRFFYANETCVCDKHAVEIQTAGLGRLLRPIEPPRTVMIPLGVQLGWDKVERRLTR